MSTPKKTSGPNTPVLPERALLRSAPEHHPVGQVTWVDPDTLHSNEYNPNRVFGSEMGLLLQSIIEDGWTQPIVARRSGEIVDGFHRWTTSMRHPEVRAMAGGKVPVVYIDDSATLAEQMAATVRHNRARGKHGILSMGHIVSTLRTEGLTDEDIRQHLGMEQEEIDRLPDATPSPDSAGKESFGRGWVPTTPEALGRLRAPKTGSQ
jgi:ParB-like chromosome segregation protein Spo0J